MCRVLCGTIKFLKGLLIFSLIFILETLKSCVPYACKRKKSLRGKVILISGSGSGIGRELAIQLAKFRPVLILWSRVKTTNLETKRLIKEKYWRLANQLRIFVYTCDVGNRIQVNRAAEKVKNEIGYVDILINNAAIIQGRMLVDLVPEEIERTINTNLMAHYWTIKEFLPGMLDRNSGHIVAISSVAGIVDYVARKTIEAIRTDKPFLYIPRMLYIILATKGLTPHAALRYMGYMFGAHTAMNYFVGREHIV